MEPKPAPPSNIASVQGVIRVGTNKTEVDSMALALRKSALDAFAAVIATAHDFDQAMAKVERVTKDGV